MVAFTLAEVLIVLGIIGIVAQMTIPTLVKNVETQVTVASLKKTYSTFESAFRLAIQQNGTVDQWGLTDIYSSSGQGALDAMNIIVPYLKISEKCGISDGCYPNSNYTFLDKSATKNYYTDATRAKFILADGVIADFMIRDISCNSPQGTTPNLSSVCGDLDVDINGAKGPNVFGRDYFRFWITKYGVIPRGTSLDSSTFEAGCIVGNGATCSAWALMNENLDYTKCPSQLSWVGQHKCS